LLIIEIGMFSNGHRGLTGTKRRMPSQRGVTGSELFLQKVEKSALRFDYSEIKILRPQIREF